MRKRALVGVVLSLFVCLAPAAQDRIPAVEFANVQKLVQDRCSACHDWPASAEGIRSKVVPGKPEASIMWKMISSGQMPPEGPLSRADQELIRSWILAGAPIASAAGAGGPAARSDTGRFLGFPSKVSYHQTAGFSSAALFGVAGILGAAQWVTLISSAHAYRDANGIDEETMSPACTDYIIELRNSPEHRAIRWTHVGLLSAGELLYLGNAATGISMFSPERPGLTAADLHRYAFFTHATLMLGQLILGALTTTMISQGNHWTMIAVGAAHSAIGIAIPTIMTAAGLAVNAGFPR